MMAMRRTHEAWAPHEHRKRPGRQLVSRTERHDRILASCVAPCKIASSFKTRPNPAYYDEKRCSRVGVVERGRRREGTNEQTSDPGEETERDAQSH